MWRELPPTHFQDFKTTLVCVFRLSCCMLMCNHLRLPVFNLFSIFNRNRGFVSNSGFYFHLICVLYFPEPYRQRGCNLEELSSIIPFMSLFGLSPAGGALEPSFCLVSPPGRALEPSFCLVFWSHKTLKEGCVYVCVCLCVYVCVCVCVCVCVYRIVSTSRFLFKTFVTFLEKTSTS